MSRRFHGSEKPAAAARKVASEASDIASCETGRTRHWRRGPVGDAVIAVHLALVLFATWKIIALLAGVFGGP
jgi:hypothetical protein